MSQDRLVRLQSSASKHLIIAHKKKGKNKKGVERKIDLIKYDPVARKRVPFKEIRWKGKGG